MSDEQKRWRVTVEMTRTDKVLDRLGKRVDLYLCTHKQCVQQAVITAIEEIQQPTTRVRPMIDYGTEAQPQRGKPLCMACATKATPR